MRQSWLIDAELLGGHVHIAIRCGAKDEARALAGRITVREEEWPALRATLVRGFDALGAAIDVTNLERGAIRSTIGDELRLEIRTKGFGSGEAPEASEGSSDAPVDQADEVREASSGDGSTEEETLAIQRDLLRVEPISAETAKAAVMEQAFHQPTIESEGVEERFIVHSFLGMMGCDWDRDDVLEMIDRAEQLGWNRRNLFRHQLLVRASYREGQPVSDYYFDVRAPS